MHALPHSVPLTLQQATADPCLCWRLLDTHRQICVNLLWGHCSFLLGLGVQQVLFVLSKSLFPQSRVSSGGSMVGLMVTSSKRAYAIPRSAVLRAPALQQATVDPYLCRRHWNTHRQVWFSLCGISWCAQGVVWALCGFLMGMGFDSKCDFALPTVCWGFSFALGCGYFFWWDPTFSCWSLFSSKL